jgi:hypothetical protein
MGVHFGRVQTRQVQAHFVARMDDPSADWVCQIAGAGLEADRASCHVPGTEAGTDLALGQTRDRIRVSAPSCDPRLDQSDPAQSEVRIAAGARLQTCATRILAVPAHSAVQIQAGSFVVASRAVAAPAGR